MSAVPPLAEPDSSGSPALIGDRFEVLAVLGRGGMGTVYRVRDRANDRLLALKRVSFVARPTLRTLFEREYTTLARLNHPLVIDVYDYALEGDGAAYYTMELLDGDDLSRLAPLPYPLACRYLRQVATMLALLHARHLVHRDLSPRNVRITERDACKLLDFGALAAFGEAGAVIGTAPCVPPEAFDHEALDQRVDLYGLGCLAYFALTGRHAYPASQVEQLPSYWAQAIDPPSTLVADRQANDRTLPAIPKELDEWVLSLLHLDRSARPTSAGAALDRLNVILGEGARDEFEQAASYLASAPTIGRELQLDAAKHWTDQALRGRGQVLVFEGTAGAGKTHLLQEIALAARLRGPSVVTVDASASDRPFGTARALCRGLFEVAGIAALDAARPHAEWLAAIAPALGGALPNEAPARDAAWNDEAQAALLDFIIELSRRTPLVLSIDNFHVCDQPSAALIAMLGREAKQLPLSLMATVRPDENSPYTRALRMNGEVFGLDRLNSSQLATWLGALFGRDTPNLPRLCQFVHAETGGQPGDAIELLYALLHAKQIRYTDGSWVLPLSPAEAALPSTAEASLLLRLQNLNGDARRLAGALCLYRGRLTRELCHTLSQLDATSLQLALRELLDARILVQQRDTYAFAHDAIREALRAQVPDGERGTLQRRIADVILSRETLRVEEKLDAGLHLFEAGDPRGIRLLCRSGVTLSQRPQNIASCTPILERALALAKARGRGRLELVCLLAPLAVSAYAADRRLDRYAGELSECFDHLLGLSIARKLRPFIGKHLSSYVGLIAGAIRHRLTPASQRHAHFLSIVPMLIASIMALCGRAAICLDRSQIDKHMALLEPLTVFGRTNPIQFAYDYCRALSLVTQDRHSKTYELCLDLEQRLSTPAIMRHVGAEARRFWQGGLHYLLGLFESFSSDPRVLARCEQLEQSAFSVERLIAAQLRRLYHTFRGEAEPLRRANEQVEAYALQTGSTWQVETWSAIITNYAACLWNDSVSAKRAADETQRLAAVLPSLQRYAISSAASYSLEVGQPRQCIALYEEMLTREKARERVGWSVAVGMLAGAYNEIGEYARARAICEDELQQLDPGDIRFAGMRLPISSALVFALASLGEHAAAERYLNELLALYAQNASPLVLGTLHESAARIAWLRGDRKAFTQHLKEVERHFCPLGQAALIGRFLRLTALGGTEGDMGAQIASMREVKAFDNALAALHDRNLLARHAFAWLMQKCEGFTGYLFLPNGAAPMLVESNDAREPPAAVVELAKRGLGSMSMEDVTTHCGPVELNTQAERPRAKRDSHDDVPEILHVHLLSFVDDERFCGEGALVLRSTRARPPRLRYDLLQLAAKHLHRARGETPTLPQRSTPPTTDRSATA